MQGALLRIAQTGPYAMHEIRTAAGTNVRQFVSPSGTVFGVAWDGPWQPDLHQLLGAYFDRPHKLFAALGKAAARCRSATAISWSKWAVSQA
jgi:hypothetical protein